MHHAQGVVETSEVASPNGECSGLLRGTPSTVPQQDRNGLAASFISKAISLIGEGQACDYLQKALDCIRWVHY